MRQLASLSAQMDKAPRATRMAVVAPQSLAFGLGRMYSAFREMDDRSRKQVEIFRTLHDAMAFLEKDNTPPGG